MSVPEQAASSPMGIADVSPSRVAWIVSARFDLLFLANLGWLILVIPGLLADDRTLTLEFWQIYYLTTPHRWITLGLVLFDPDRRAGRLPHLLALLALVAVVVPSVYVITGSFLCLVWFDFLWNAWHFASQHYGILRIYGRKSGTPFRLWEAYGLRLFVCYAILRVPGWSSSWLPDSARTWLSTVDLLMLAVPIALLARALIDFRAVQLGKLIYLGSVCGIYSGILVTPLIGAYALRDALFLGVAIFHATEYLAIVTHYARGRASDGSPGLFQAMARNWGLVLLGFLVLLGTLDAYAHGVWFELASGLNLAAAFLHYGYDGLIWKLRRPETARALGVGTES